MVKAFHIRNPGLKNRRYRLRRGRTAVEAALQFQVFVLTPELERQSPLFEMIADRLIADLHGKRTHSDIVDTGIATLEADTAKAQREGTIRVDFETDLGHMGHD